MKRFENIKEAKKLYKNILKNGLKEEDKIFIENFIENGFYEDEGGSIGLTDLTLYYDSSSSVTTTSNTLYASNTFYVGWTIASRHSLNILMNVGDWSPASVSLVAKTETGKTALSVGENIVTTLPVGTVGTGIKEYLVTVSLDGVQKDSSYSTTATLMVVVI